MNASKVSNDSVVKRNAGGLRGTRGSQDSSQREPTPLGKRDSVHTVESKVQQHSKKV